MVGLTVNLERGFVVTGLENTFVHEGADCMLERTYALGNLSMDDRDDPLSGIDSWEEYMALPWEVQQECERRFPEQVRLLELEFEKEHRFPAVE